MFDVRNQEQRIRKLKEQVRAERETAARQLRAIVPQTRRAAAIGSLVWGARKFLPLLQPVALGLTRKLAGNFGAKRLVKAVGLVAVAVGLWRVLRADNNRN